MKLSKKEIFYMVSNNNINELEKLIKDGLDPNTIKHNTQNRTSLLEKAVLTNLETDAMVEMLISNGAVANNSNIIRDACVKSFKTTYLVLNSHKQHLLNQIDSDALFTSDLKDEMKDRIINPEKYNSDELFDDNTLINGKIYNPIKVYFSNLNASLLASTQSFETTNLLFENGAKIDIWNDPLSAATFDGDLSTMKLLLEHGSKINEKSLYGSCDYPRLPIEAAVQLNDFEKIKFLLTNGADVNSPLFKNSLLEKAIYNYDTYSFDEQKEKMETASSIVSLLLDYHAPLEFLDWEKNAVNSSVLNLVNHYELLELFDAFQHRFTKKDEVAYFNKRLKLLLK